MKHYPVLILIAFALFFSCSNDKKAVSFEDLDYGVATKGRYHNETLGWTMNLPTDWIIKEAPSDDVRPGASAEAQRMMRRKQLLAICREPTNCNNALAILAQDTNSVRGTNSPEAFAKRVIEQDEENNRPYLVKGHYKQGKAEFGGKEFHMLEITRENKNGDFQFLKQIHYFRLFGPHMIRISVNYESEPNKMLALEALNSSKFED